MPQRGGDPSWSSQRGHPAGDPRCRRARSPRRRRRQAGSARSKFAPGARGDPLRPPRAQHGPGPLLPGRDRLHALANGADIVVNTGGDNQYPGTGSRASCTSFAGDADIVIAGPDLDDRYFSVFKKLMQRFGSFIVNRAASTELPDAASGFGPTPLRPALPPQRGARDLLHGGHHPGGQQADADRPRSRCEPTPRPASPGCSGTSSTTWGSRTANVRSLPDVQAVRDLRDPDGGVGLAALTLVRFLVRAQGPTRATSSPSSSPRSWPWPRCILALGVISDLLRTNRVLLEGKLRRIKEVQYR